MKHMCAHALISQMVKWRLTGNWKKKKNYWWKHANNRTVHLPWVKCWPRAEVLKQELCEWPGALLDNRRQLLRSCDKIFRAGAPRIWPAFKASQALLFPLPWPLSGAVTWVSGEMPLFPHDVIGRHARYMCGAMEVAHSGSVQVPRPVGVYQAPRPSTSHTHKQTTFLVRHLWKCVATHEVAMWQPVLLALLGHAMHFCTPLHKAALCKCYAKCVACEKKGWLSHGAHFKLLNPLPCISEL